MSHSEQDTLNLITQCNSGWPLQEESDPMHRVVHIPTDLQTSFHDMGESPSGPVCDQSEYKTSPICLSDSGPSGLGSRCPEHTM